MKIIDIYTTKYVINIAYSIKLILEKLNYKVNVLQQSITNEEINLVSKNSNKLLFFLCIQWVYSKNLQPLPKNKYIIYQLEQLDRKNNYYLNNDFIHLLYKNALYIFDYSKVNIQYLSNFKEKLSFLIPPVVKHDEKTYKKIYDVLFVGCINEKRNKILLELNKVLNNVGIKLQVESNCFGEPLKKKIKQSKIFLNFRFSDSSILETCRLSEAMGVKDIFIISELPKNSLDSIKYYKKRVVFVEQNNIISLIKAIKITLNLYNFYKPDLTDLEKINLESFETLNTILPSIF